LTSSNEGGIFRNYKFKVSAKTGKKENKGKEKDETSVEVWLCVSPENAKPAALCFFALLSDPTKPLRRLSKFKTAVT